MQTFTRENLPNVYKYRAIHDITIIFHTKIKTTLMSICVV